MNGTNRALNRLVLLIVGVALLAAGGFAAVAAAWPDAGAVWGDGLGVVQEWSSRGDEQTRWAGSGASWLMIGCIGALLLVAVLCVVVISRLGRRRSTPVLTSEAGDEGLGGVIVRPAFASEAIGHALAADEQILATRVVSARVKGHDVLHVDVVSRKRTSPVAVADLVRGTTEALAMLTGRELPVLISIRSTVRARLAADQPRVN